MKSEAIAAWRRDPAAFAAAFLLILAIILGGGGADGAVNNGIVEAIAALGFIAAAAAHFAGRPLPRQALAPLLFLAATLLLIAFQLLPLPPQVWMRLPGRETAAAVSQLIGYPGQWRPLSLDPEATRAHAAALLVPAAMILIAIRAGHRGLILANRALVFAALLSATVGALQIGLDSPPALFLYGEPLRGAASGLFANPNHQAALMLAALVSTGLMIRLESPQLRIRRAGGEMKVHLGWLLVPIFMALTVAAQSRAGLILLVPATVCAVLLASRRKGIGRLLVLFLAVLAALAAILAFTPGSLTYAMGLTTETSGSRLTLLPDVLYTLRQYWPWGSGLGTFIPVYQANENLDLLQPLRVNHAHNDLLEWLLETGLPGALLLGAGLAALGWRMLRLLKTRSSADAGPALAGLTILSLLLLHSLVDYPLRTRALAAVAALAIVFIVSPAQQRPASERAPSRSRRRKGFARIASAAPELAP